MINLTRKRFFKTFLVLHILFSSIILFILDNSLNLILIIWLKIVSIYHWRSIEHNVTHNKKHKFMILITLQNRMELHEVNNIASTELSFFLLTIFFVNINKHTLCLLLELLWNNLIHIRLHFVHAWEHTFLMNIKVDKVVSSQNIFI
jgi:hypothetical protein